MDGPADPSAGPAEGRATEIDAAEAELAGRLRLAVTRLHRRLRQQTGGQLTPSQGAALASAARLGAPTLGELAATESVQPPSMTRIVAALEEQGLVTRVADEADRRVFRVVLTPLGTKMIDQSRSLKTAYLAQQLHRLTPAERRALGELTSLIERLGEAPEP